MTKLTIKIVAEMSDEEVYQLSTPRPGHSEQRGFMLSLQHFENQQEMADCMYVLLQRLQKIKQKD